jgi:hypothetical protein
MGFEKNVFINCPFDEEYLDLLRPLLFTILYLGLDPQISETKDSNDIRINKIKTLIRSSKFSIHDISKSGPMHQDEYPRFNMPYELGLDIGCKEYGGKKFGKKRCLILESNRYLYQRVLSDIAGQDISSHDKNPEKLIQEVRNWFAKILIGIPLTAPNKIWEKYNEFKVHINYNLRNEGWNDANIKGMPFSEFIYQTKTGSRIFKPHRNIEHIEKANQTIAYMLCALCFYVV